MANYRRKLQSETDLRLAANSIRQSLIRSLAEAKSGHSAGPLGMVEVFTALYFNVLNGDPGKPLWPERDRLILSHGHICPVRYAAMAEAGYFPKEELMTLRKLHTRLQGHPHHLDLPGLESTSGPLGQGTSIAAGMALAAKMDEKGHRVVLLTSDGESNEGQPWEAYMFAAKYGLDNLVGVLDRNYIQIDGNTEDVMPLDPLADKFKAFNWHVIEVDGHDFKALLAAFGEAEQTKGRPTMILARTVPGKGVSFMENDYRWHGKPPNAEEAQKALKELEEERRRIKSE
ncbi:MAG: transketolase [Candidatus Micrarchaeota archaeon]